MTETILYLCFLLFSVLQRHFTQHVSLTFLSVATAIASPSHRRLKITISLFLVELLVFKEDCFCFVTTEKTKLVSLHNKLIVYLIYTDRWVSKWLVAESTSFDMIMLSVLNQGYLNSLVKTILHWELFLFSYFKIWLQFRLESERLLVFTIFL